MARRPRPMSAEQRAEMRQAASDALCEALSLTPFVLPDHVPVPGGLNALTHPDFPSWYGAATAAWRVQAVEAAPRRASGVDFDPIAWAREHGLTGTS